MMGMMNPEDTGPKAPAHLPMGDQGWDWDPAAAPGTVPEQHFIQTTVIHNSKTDQEKKYATSLLEVVKKIQQRLKKEARVTVDNEYIDCSNSEHHRCADFPSKMSYHFLVVEDATHGAAVYSLDIKYNEKNEGTIENAVLDALSRHSPRSLMLHASKTADKDLGFVRKLSSKELTAMGSSHLVKLSPQEFSPAELRLLEAKLLELRHTEGLDTISNGLSEFQSKEGMDRALKEHKYVFVLFWTNVMSVSLHTFNTWARLSQIWDDYSVNLAHVQCHLQTDFCAGLKTDDFNTIVAFKNGEKIATTAHLGNIEYYLNWILLTRRGPLTELTSVDNLKDTKRGVGLVPLVSAVTIGMFPNTDCQSFKHFEIAAEKLTGRYALVYHIDEKYSESISTYRFFEKQKRRDMEGDLHPAAIINFITVSSMPNIVDISDGFTTDFLFRNPRSILTVISASDSDLSIFEKLSNREDVKKVLTITKINRYTATATEVLKRLHLENENTNFVVLFVKENIFYLKLQGTETDEQIWAWIQHADFNKPDVQLTDKDVHPLRMIQVAHINKTYGEQDTMILPDNSIFQIKNIKRVDAGGGCPFMSQTNHDEL